MCDSLGHHTSMTWCRVTVTVLLLLLSLCLGLQSSFASFSLGGAVCVYNNGLIILINSLALMTFSANILSISTHTCNIIRHPYTIACLKHMYLLVTLILLKNTFNVLIVVCVSMPSLVFYLSPLNLLIDVFHNQ